MKARGEPLRANDHPDVRRRLLAYHRDRRRRGDLIQLRACCGRSTA